MAVKANVYKDIMNMLKEQQKAVSDSDKLMADLNSYLQLSREKHTPSATIKPSGVGGCLRNQYFILMDEVPDAGKLDAVPLIGMTETGNYRHERLQNAFMDMANFKMPVTWVALKDEMSFIQSKGINTRIKREDGNETLCYNEDYNSNFKCDGVILYENHKYLIEIKTCEHRKFQAITEPLEAHRDQATAYSIFLDIPEIIFIYENRNLFDKKAYIFTPTEESKDELKLKMRLIQAYAKGRTVPDKNKDKCLYCNYKNACRTCTYDELADNNLLVKFNIWKDTNFNAEFDWSDSTNGNEI